MANNKTKSTISTSTTLNTVTTSNNSTSLVPTFREKFSSIKVEEENLKKTGKVVIYLPSIAKIIAGLKSRDKYIVLFDANEFLTNSSAPKKYVDEFFVSVDDDTKNSWKEIFHQIDISVRNNIPWTKAEYKCWYDDYREYFYSAIDREEKPHRAIDYFAIKKRSRKEVKRYNTYKYVMLINVILITVMIVYGIGSAICSHIRGTEPSLIQEGYQYTIVRIVQSDFKNRSDILEWTRSNYPKTFQNKTDNEVWDDILRVNNTKDLDKHLDITDEILIRVVEPIGKVRVG